MGAKNSNANHMAVRCEISQKLLDRFAAEGDSFLMRILTYNESWVHHYTLETTRSSMEWRAKGETPLVKAKTRLSVGKVLMTVFLETRVVVYVD